MPRRFPGVDPYIEDQGYWPDFHGSFITYIRDTLLNHLPDNYEAVIDEQFRLFDASNDHLTVEPDVAVVELGRRPNPTRGSSFGGTTLLEPVQVTIGEFDPETIRHSWVEIRRFPERRLVAVIELLSPTNKYGKGRIEYLTKRRGYVHQSIHLIEIDLLLRGARLPVIEPLPAGDCYAIVARARSRPRADVYAWSIRRTLPPIPIPLLPPDPDILLDLAALYETAFERGRYSRRLDYSRALQAPLKEEDQAWAAALTISH